MSVLTARARITGMSGLFIDGNYGANGASLCAYPHGRAGHFDIRACVVRPGGEED